MARDSNFPNVLQNTLSASTFALICGAQMLAYLVYMFPGSELLWMLNVPVRRLVAPLLVQIQTASGLGPVALTLALAALVLVPIVSCTRRNWLGTASCAHVALGVFVLLTAFAVQREATGLSTASLTPINVAGRMGFSSISLGIMTLVFVVLCAANHVFFFSRARRAR